MTEANLFSTITELYRQEDPCKYTLTHYVLPMILLSIVVSGLLQKYGDMHGMCAVGLVIIAILASTMIMTTAVYTSYKLRRECKCKKS